MQTVILCGGKGMRMGQNELPKPLFPIGDKPILWHIMRIYAYYGFKDFILCLGYKGKKIRDYFASTKEWSIKFVDTGLETNTGGRLKRVENYIEEDCFFATYGDGLADINLNRLLDFHKKHNKAAVLTAVRPCSPFGIVDICSRTASVTHFKEKPKLDHWINGGFFVFGRDIFKYLKDGDVLEKETFARVLKDKNLSAYKHKGFWECMDTYKDNLRLNQLWSEGSAPWALWRKDER